MSTIRKLLPINTATLTTDCLVGNELMMSLCFLSSSFVALLVFTYHLLVWVIYCIQMVKKEIKHESEISVSSMANQVLFSPNFTVGITSKDSVSDKQATGSVHPTLTLSFLFLSLFNIV